MGRAWARLACLGLVAFLCPSAMVHAAPSPADVGYPSDSTYRFTARALAPGETLERLFGDAWEDVARFNRMDRRHARAGVRIRVPDSLAAIRCFTPMPERLEDAAAEPRLVWLDLSEQFLGAYEAGRLVFSAPVCTGMPGNATPAGEYLITRAHRDHRSNLYTIEGTNRPYPMDWALHFLFSREGTNYWMHGRDLPGFPASHGCVGLSDEAMQARCYGTPATPRLADARRLYGWALGGLPDSTHTARFSPAIPLRVTGEAPVPRQARAAVSDAWPR